MVLLTMSNKTAFGGDHLIWWEHGEPDAQSDASLSKPQTPKT